MARAEKPTRQQIIDDARQMIDFLEANPEVPVEPIDIKIFFHSFVEGRDKESFIKATRSLGAFEKEQSLGDFVAVKRFGSSRLKLAINQNEVCKKVTVMREVEEWECSPLLSPAEVQELGREAA